LHVSGCSSPASRHVKNMAPLFLVCAIGLLAHADAWCAPSESGDCDFVIRAGKQATDNDMRAIKFFNNDHIPTASIKVVPRTEEMLLHVGNEETHPPTVRISPGKVDIMSTLENSLHVKGGAEFEKSIIVHQEGSLQVSNKGEESIFTHGGLHAKGNVVLGNKLRVHGTEDATQIGNGALHVAGGMSVGLGAHIKTLTVHGLTTLRDSVTVESDVRISATTPNNGSPSEGALVVNGGLGVSGKSTFVQPVHVQAEKGLSGVKVLPSGGVKIFSYARDGFLDFESKDLPGSDDVKSPSTIDGTLRAMQMGIEGSLLIHSGKIVIDQNGNVGVGVAQPTHNLHVKGRVRASMSTITTSSDERLKTNIQSVDMKESLRNILGLKVRDFEWKKDLSKNSTERRLRRGFIAQEVETIIPGAVQTVDGGDDHPSINDLRLLNLDPIIFDLVGAVQALKEELAEERRARQAECGKGFGLKRTTAD
jgi:hypothetical protein